METSVIVATVLVAIIAGLFFLYQSQSKNGKKKALKGAGGDTGVFYVSLHKADSLPDPGKTDPYCILYIDDVSERKTETFTDNESPAFDTDYTVYVEGKPKELKIQLWDEESYRRDDLIGEIVIPLAGYYDGKKMKEETHQVKLKGKQVGNATLTMSLNYISTESHFHPTPTSKKRALCIGINYIDKPKGDGGLEGCVPDAHEMKEALIKNFGFEAENIKLLVDEGNKDKKSWPTKKNIINEIRWLLHGTKAGDSLVFNYSGHGTQVKDRNGDEEDGLDEALCPCDQDKAGVIIDDDLKKMLVDALPAGARLMVVIDACHSGSILDLPYNRNFHETSPGEFREDTEYDYHYTEAEELKPKGKRVHPKLGAAPERVGGRRRRAKVKGFQAKPVPGAASSKDVICISGCEDSDVSMGSEFDGGKYGAMTWAFLKVMNSCGGDCTYAELVTKIRKLIVHRKLTQVPQLSTLRPFDLNEKVIM